MASNYDILFRGSSSSVEDLSLLVVVRIANWAAFKSEFDSSKIDGVLHNWEASLLCGVKKAKKVFFWAPPIGGVLKFNVNGAARGKPDLAGIGGGLHKSEGIVLALFSKHVGCMESNEVDVLAILEAIRIFSSASFQSSFVVQSDSLNAISWVSSSTTFPWKSQFYMNEIRALLSLIQVGFKHVGRSANCFANSLAKQGADRYSDLVAFTL